MYQYSIQIKTLQIKTLPIKTLRQTELKLYKLANIYADNFSEEIVFEQLVELKFL